MDKKYKGAIFDLDGVIVDTAKYHYLAWKHLADELGFEFTEQDNERLKGVSRMRSLEILLSIGGLEFDASHMQDLAEKKNIWYVEYLKSMDESELLPGAKNFLEKLRSIYVKIALGSASKNAPVILEKLNITYLFDSIVDGNKITTAKPDPEVFLLGAQELGVSPKDCVVFEDAQAGIIAAKSAGCYAVGIGEPQKLVGADMHIPGLYVLDIHTLF